MSLFSGIKNLFTPAYKTAAYKQQLEELYKKRKGPLQLQNKTALPDDDMLPLIGTLSNNIWAAKIVNSRKHDRFYIYYYGEVTDELIDCLPNVLPIKVKIVDSFTREEIELYDEAYDGYDAVLNCFYEEDKLEDRPAEKKYLSPEKLDEFRILIVVN